MYNFPISVNSQLYIQITAVTHKVHHSHIATQWTGWTNQKYILPQQILHSTHVCNAYNTYIHLLIQNHRDVKNLGLGLGCNGLVNN